MIATMIEYSPVATAILGLTLFVSLFGLFGHPDIVRAFALHPYSVVRHGRWHTLLTSGFVHADPAHLAFNMLTFHFFAVTQHPQAQGLETHMGSVPFLALYLVAIVASSITTLIKRKDDPNYLCLGASGGVTAVIFSFIVYVPTAKIMLIFLPIPIPAPLFGGLYIVLSYYLMRRGRGRVNHEAHLWGAVSGLLMTLLLDPQAYEGFWQQVKGLGA